MTESFDYNEAGEIFRKSMEDALANLDKVTEEAKLAHEKAIDEQIAAKDEFKRIQNDAHKISEAYIEKHRKEFEDRLREEILFKITKNMIMDGQPTEKVYRWLEVSQKMMADAWFELGFEALGNHIANVSYDQKGRAGDVIFYREDIVLRFPFEFAGGLALATIEIPSEEKWTSQTGLPIEDRMPIIEFTAKRIIRDQAQGYKYLVGPDLITITLE